MGLGTPNFLYWFDAVVVGQFAMPELEPGSLTVNSLKRSGNNVSELVILGSNVTPTYSDHIATGMLVFVINKGLFLDPNQAIQSKSGGGSTKSTTIKSRDGTNPAEIELL